MAGLSPQLMSLLTALISGEIAIISTPAARKAKRRSRWRSSSSPTRGGTKRVFSDDGNVRVVERPPKRRSCVAFASEEMAVWDMAEDRSEAPAPALPAVEDEEASLASSSAPLPQPAPLGGRRESSDANGSVATAAQTALPAFLEHLHAALEAAAAARAEMRRDAALRADAEALVESLRAEDDSNRAARFLATEIEMLLLPEKAAARAALLEDTPGGGGGGDGPAAGRESTCSSASQQGGHRRRESRLAWRHFEVLSSIVRRELKVLLNETILIKPGTGSVRYNFEDPAALFNRALTAIAEAGGPAWPQALQWTKAAAAPDASSSSSSANNDGKEEVVVASHEDAHDLISVASAHGFAMAVLSMASVAEKVEQGAFAGIEALAAMLKPSRAEDGDDIVVTSNAFDALLSLRDVAALSADLLAQEARVEVAALSAFTFLTKHPDPATNAPPPAADQAAAAAAAHPKSAARKRKRTPKRQRTVTEELEAAGVFLYPSIVDFAEDDADAEVLAFAF